MQKALRVLLAFLLFGTALPLLAKKDIVQQRQKRLEFAETQWQQPEKVTLNVHYRVPVIEVLGYLAANYDNMQKLDQIVLKLRPIAKRVRELSGDTFEGRTFPPELKVETQQLRNAMMADVTAIYGSGVTQQLEAYLDQKYSSMRGIFGPLN